MSIIDRIRREPVLITALVQAILALVVAFGLSLSGEQTASILAVTAALLAIIARGQVTPTVSVAAEEKTPGEQPVAGPASEVKDGTLVDVVPAEPTAYDGQGSPIYDDGP